MKALIIVLSLVAMTGCSSMVQKEAPEQLVKIGEHRYEVGSVADYARENDCKEYFVRGKYYCADGRKFRAVHR